ncbi:MAG: hypothetical protein WCC61_16845 [Pseudomonas sp.]|jgi:hypothetical protein|uniref:hypothetical protein n=1 Tax=Pseudomonas sp. TaxID=306 RepID=UPI003C7B5B50
MEGIDSAEKLCFIAAVLKSFIRSYGWGGSSAASDLEEVQCMTFVGKEVIYIAGNKGEHTKILESLNAYGVATTTDLMSLISLSHRLTSLTHTQKSKAKIAALTHKYSLPEKAVVLQEAYTPALSALSDIQLAGIVAMLGDAKKYLDVKAANKPVTAKKNAVSPPPVSKNIGDALDKFKASHSGKKVLFLCKLFDVVPPEDYRVTPPILAAVSTPASTVSNGFTVHVIENSEDAHAELALLKFFTAGVLDGTFSDVSKVYVGGLKAACRHCKSWIENYKGLFKAGSGLSLEEAGDGARTERQHNQGHCPNLVAKPSTKLAANSSLFAMLFGGTAIEGIAWGSVSATEPTTEPTSAPVVALTE